jgi:predicted nucleic acid-binding protein
MYLVGTDVISEARKGARANSGVRTFFAEVGRSDTPIFISVITIGELRRGVELIRHRGDAAQAARLDRWLGLIVGEYAHNLLGFDEDIAQVWGALRAPHGENALDKQIAATALTCELTVVTRNVRHFPATGVRTLNPFN